MNLNIKNQELCFDNKVDTTVKDDHQLCPCKPSSRWRVQRMLAGNKQLSISLQRTANSGVDVATSLYNRIINISTNLVNWMFKTNFGVSKLVGVRLISAQLHILHAQQQSRKIIDTVCNAEQADGCRFEKISMSYGSVNLSGVICYPPGWDANENSDCILYHNPNGHTISQFFSNNKLATTDEGQVDGVITDTPGNMQKLKNCPIILYDYRGTGINKTEGIWYYLPTATAETAIEDGITALHYALTRFSGNVIILGSSMGGGIATVSLANYLDATDDCKNIESRVTIINHDSYTTTSCVMIPQYPNLANTLGSWLKSQIDAQEAMECLSKRTVKILVLAHGKDNIIPKGARMITFFPVESSTTTSSFTSERFGHANLSADQLVAISSAIMIN
jgi:hypothetical protein